MKKNTKIFIIEDDLIVGKDVRNSLENLGYSVLGVSRSGEEALEKLEKMKEDIKAVIKPPAKLGNIEVKPVAFGLKGLNVTVVVPDDALTVLEFGVTSRYEDSPF